MTALLCPVCSAAFKEMNRDGILIDVCTQCRGVWLDRGELEKLLANVRSDFSASSEIHARRSPEKHYDYDDDDERYRHAKGHAHYRKKSKFETLFDLFD